MEKMNQALEKMKMLVGMDVEDEETAPQQESSFVFMDDLNRNCTLSTKQDNSMGQTVGTGYESQDDSCHALDAAPTADLPFPSQSVALQKEALWFCYMLNNWYHLYSLVDAGFLQSNQVWNNIFLREFACSWKVRNKLLTLLSIVLEFGALIWYSLSYVPFARSMVSKVVMACFDTEY